MQSRVLQVLQHNTLLQYLHKISHLYYWVDHDQLPRFGTGRQSELPALQVLGCQVLPCRTVGYGTDSNYCPIT